MEGEKRLSNEKSTRAMDQVEVQFLRSENQRLRELAFRANMSAFQASVQLPQNQFAGYNQAIVPPFTPGGTCYDPYGMQRGEPPRRKSVFQRIFGKKEDDPAYMYQDGQSQMMFDPIAAMNAQRMSIAPPMENQEGVENPENEKKGCCK